jgi:translocation and assembly module TamB
VGGDLKLEKAANETGGPAITGTVSIVRGFYEFQGRRFEVVRDSELRFGGFKPMNPTLRIDAERDISGVVAQIHLRGSMRRPQLNLTSQPPLDPSDILSLIVFNAPVNELGSSERTSLSERAGVIAAGFVADPLTRSLGRALDVDYFEVRASGSRGEPSVGVGEQIGDKLYVRFEQQFGSDQVSQLQFEYRLADFVRLVTSVAEGGQTSRSPTRRVEAQAVDLIFQWSY